MRRFILSLILSILFVIPAFAGQATLAWDPPTTNEDGTPLTDLAGYKIYWGGISGNYPNSLDVGNILTKTVTGLPAGTWYFVATAYDTSNNESRYSNEVVKSVIVSNPGLPGLDTRR